MFDAILFVLGVEFVNCIISALLRLLSCHFFIIFLIALPFYREMVSNKKVQSSEISEMDKNKMSGHLMFPLFVDGENLSYKVF